MYIYFHSITCNDNETYSNLTTISTQAVMYFQYGQPALLYIVPLMLIPVLWRTMEDGTLTELWEKLPLQRAVCVPLGSEERYRGGKYTLSSRFLKVINIYFY